MVGEFGRRSRGGQLGVCRQGLGDHTVQAQAFAGQGVVVDCLAQQRVTERVGHPVAGEHEHVMLDRLTEGGL